MGLIGYFFVFDVEDGEYSSRFDICSAIIDWVDANQDLESCEGTSQATSAPAEDSYYRNLPDPYPRKNVSFGTLAVSEARDSPFPPAPHAAVR